MKKIKIFQMFSVGAILLGQSSISVAGYNTCGYDADCFFDTLAQDCVSQYNFGFGTCVLSEGGQTGGTCRCSSTS